MKRITLLVALYLLFQTAAVASTGGANPKAGEELQAFLSRYVAATNPTTFLTCSLWCHRGRVPV